MQRVHASGWRLMQLPDLGGEDICHRLCRDDIWIGDYQSAELATGLGGHGVLIDEFIAADEEWCVMVDPRTGSACEHLAEPVDGRAHLPMCRQCRRFLSAMRGFPRHGDTRTSAVALARLGGVAAAGAEERDRRELAHHVRHPLAKILGWAEILQEDDTLGAAQARQIEVIYQAARDLQRLLDAVTTAT